MTSCDAAGTANPNIYVHEIIDIVGHNRARYMHHMTAGFSPLAAAERRLLCFGVWGLVGTTGHWPKVVNIWEHPGWHGLAHNLGHELSNPSLQDPELAEWWAEAASFRSGGYDRVLEPAEWSPTIGQLLAFGTRGELYAQDTIVGPPGSADAILADLRDTLVPVHREFDVTLVGAFKSALGDDSQVIVVWSIATWAAWAELESAQARHTGLARWQRQLTRMQLRRRRELLVEAPLSPMRLGRQPQAEDRLNAPT